MIIPVQPGGVGRKGVFQDWLGATLVGEGGLFICKSKRFGIILVGVLGGGGWQSLGKVSESVPSTPSN